MYQALPSLYEVPLKITFTVILILMGFTLILGTTAYYATRFDIVNMRPQKMGKD